MFSLFALVLFSLSLFMTPPAADISAEEPLTNSIIYSTNNLQTIADYPTNYTRVDWDLGTVNDVYNNTWTNNHYRFGPTINWHTRNATDSSLISWQDEIAINEYVDFRIEIPYNALGGQIPAGVYLMGQYFNMSALANSEGEFNMQGNSPNFWMVYYSITETRWLLYSSTNAIWPESPPGELPANFTLDMIFGTEVTPYAEMDLGHAGYIAGAESYWANIRLKFNSSLIGGFYVISCGVQDEHLNSLAESRFEQFNSGRILGTTFDFLVNQAVGGYYDWERVSDDGSTVHSATRGIDFNMTATITNGTPLSTASVLFTIPSNIRTQNWVYGPYTETNEVTGVWEYDDATQTYWWNAAKTVNWTAQREGFHFEEGYTFLDIGREYNFWDDYWGVMTTRWAWGMVAIVYNFTSDTFSTMLAYNYENNTWVDDHWEWIRWMEYEPFPMDGSIPLPFVINEALSESYVKDGKMVVTFRGHIGNDVLPTSGEDGRPLDVYETVTDIYGRNLVAQAQLPLSPPEAAASYQLLKELAVESPVSIVTLTHEGEPYNPDWMFRTDVAEPFTVKSWLQGGADYFQDIDGIGFFMRGYQDDWGFDGMYDWNQWSEIEVQLRIDPHGMIDIAIYNRTVRTQWGFGEHWDWTMIEVMPGRWEPQWTLIEDWFWEELTWDFVANDWVSGWLSFESPNLRMPVHWLDVVNLQQILIGNDLRVSFDILPTPELPQLEWQWKYYYGELAWVTDYESGWGEHTILGWNENTVYSYINGTKLYMDEPIKAEIFRNNATGDLYQREKVPFVEIGGVREDLASYIHTDMATSWEENVRSEFNYNTGEEEYFIKFANGTEIQVFTGSAAVIFNITLPMLGGASFLAWGDHTMYTGIDDIHSMLAVNGTFITGNWGSFWDMYMPTFYAVVETSKVDYTYVTYANGTIPIYMIGWPEYIGPDHYVMFLNGTYQAREFWWNPMWGYHYWNMSDGKLYRFDWPWELMTGIYNSKPFFIPQYMANSRVYTIVSGKEYQLPAPGVPMWSSWELNNLENIFNPANGQYFAREYAIVDGVPYEAVLLPMQEYEPFYGYWYDVYQINTGTIYNLTDWSTDPMYRMNYQYGDYWKNLPWTTVANGSMWVPDIQQEDWTVAYGHRDLSTFEFIVDGWLDLQTGYYTGDYWDSQIYEWNSTGGYDYVQTIGGEEFYYNSGWKATFLNITLANGTSFYSKQDHPIALPTDPYNFEIDQYYMIDIYNVTQKWTGWMDYTAQLIVIDDVVGDPWNGQFFFEGMYRPVFQFYAEYWWWDGSMWQNNVNMEDNIVPHSYFYLQSILNGSQYEIVELQNTPQSYKFNFPSWAFNTTVGEYHAHGAKEVIYQAFRTQGYALKLDYAPLPVTIISSQDTIVYGAPAKGMWDNDVWTVDPLSGALDLDGDLGTTYDQFYVREIHSSTDFFNVTQQYLDVSILWEPDSATWNDEFSLHSFTGMVTFNWTYDWSELNIWTHTDGTSLTAGEYAAVDALLFDSYGNPKPGYWGIAWMFENRTYADMLQQAQDEGWDWVDTNTQEWSWLWWELDEQYSTEVSNGTHSDLMDINLAYQYAGMFAWNDTNVNNFMDVSKESLGSAELTHYWMPIDVGSVTFTTPGEGWGNFNGTDSEYRAVDETIDFGVTFNNVNGQVFPFGVKSYFDWFEGSYYGSDFESFDERPTECLTEEFSLDVHFTGNVNATGANIAEVKFDITVGDWDMYTPGGIDVLEGRSLAVAFYSDITIMTSGGMTANAIYIDDLGQTITNDQAASSANFTMASGLSDVALMNLGGAAYDWSKNMSMPTTVDAQTVPVTAFSSIYVSGGGSSATTFSVASTQFYTVLGFQQWDGWAVSVDPVFVGYISHGTTDSEAPTFGGLSHAATTVGLEDAVHIQASVADEGGSEIAEVKVWDIDNNVNYTMTYNEGLGVFEIDLTRDPAHQESYNFHYRIVASDNAGNSAQTSIQTFVFRDNIDPILGTLSWDNSTDGYGNEIAIVELTVTDTGGSGVDTVTLTYSNSTGDFDVVMVLNAGSYEGTIPNHDPGTTVDFWVTAVDGDGNSVQSTTEQFTFATGGVLDTFGPSMSSISHDPVNPAPTDTVTVSANVYDVTGVDYVTLQYKVDSGAWTNVSMTGVAASYSGDIPAKTDGTTVTYQLVAMDTLGNEAVSGEFFYIVAEPTTTTTTPTDTTTTDVPTTTTTGGGTGPGTIDGQTMMLLLGGVGALILVIVIVVAMKKRN